MKDFSQCYKKTREIARDLDFKSGFEGAATVGYLGNVTAKTGPAITFHKKLDNLRAALKSEHRKTNKSLGTAIAKAASNAGHHSIGSFLKSFFSTHSLQDRSAAIKMLSHLYLVRRSGAQQVWVYSPPKGYKKWVYDEVAGRSGAKLRRRLSYQRETYSERDKKIMAEATGLAKSWTMWVEVLLAFNLSFTRDTIKDWFCTSDDQVDAALAKLKTGFGRISKVLNGNKLVLSDDPLDRNAGGWKDFAYVYPGEVLDVIYIQKATLDTGKKRNMWLAALTIIHELSHREMRTDDHRYDTDGKLAPGAAGGLTPAKAIDNADNWGYFAADMNWALASGKRKSVSGLIS